jgi:bifunctional UDP-N-acetylglucosamine pyrophosphorylase/glucosamine-1-phosphate N-acetyltransferase
MKNTAVIILAAGKSTRMKSDIPKVLHPVCGRPMIGYVLDLIKDLKIKNAIVVLGYKYEEVKKHIGYGIKIAIQKRISGTADAVKTALPLLKNFKGAVLVLYGDNPLLKKESISKLLKYHIENRLDATLLTAQLDKPTGYGRVLRDKYSSICKVVEEEDANDYQKDIKEVNTGIMCFNKQSLEQALRYVLPDNRKKEYYLTDVIGILYKKDRLIDGLRISDVNEALGINSRQELTCANKIMQERINEDFMHKGITIVDPHTTFINFGAKIGRDSKIYPFTVIESNVTIGKNCLIGPFAHLRDGTILKDNVVAGNFLEIVRSRIGNKTLLKHFGYIGDSLIGKSVNIGAGTVTANFDGKKKNTTVIKDQASIGSDTVLVAPVRIGRLAVTGAGSVVTKNKDVPDKGIVVGVPARPLKKNQKQ